MAIRIPSWQLFIDGEWREPIQKKRIPVINPATEQIIGDIPAATAEDVDVAVEAARIALSRNGGKDWATATGSYRAKFLRAIAAKGRREYDFTNNLLGKHILGRLIPELC